MKMSEKTIRFIDSRCNELFTVPDGGSITVTHHGGEQYVGVCKYLDDTHFDINGSRYHQMQFAESIERAGAEVEPEKEPETVGSYRIMRRIPVGNKVYVLGHSPNAPQPYATWRAYSDFPGKDWGHYWSNRSDAEYDLRCRADAERTGKPYDHTQRYKQKNRDNVR
jgi:hypothetical protein